MRDITVGDTFYQLFSTRQFSTGAPFTLAGSPVVSAYENESLTQITAGITLGVDHDSVTGLNLLTVVATGANGYESGKDYALVITTGTVDSVSVVGEVVAEFTIGRSAAAVDLANGTDGLGAIKTETAAILVDTGTTLDGKIDTIDTNVDAILVDTGTTLQAELDAIEAAVITNAAGVDIAADIIAIKAETAAILDDTDLIDDATSGLAKIATDVAAVLVDTGTTLDAALAVVDGNVDAILVDTGTTLQAELDAIQAAVITNAAGVDIAADIIALKAETAAILADTDDIGVAGAGLTALATQASVDTIDGIVDSILLDTAEIGAAGAGLTVLATAANLATVDTVVDGIQTDLSNATDGLGALKALIDTVNTDLGNGTDGLGALKALIDTANTALVAIQAITDLLTLANINAEVDTAWTTQMADSVATDGTIATREQAVYTLLQFLTEFGISGTTYTAYKVDGTTPLATFTLDDAVNPTAITRTT